MNGQERIIAVQQYLEDYHPLAATVRQIAVMTLMSESQARTALKELCPAPLRLKRGSTVLYKLSPTYGGAK